MSAPLLEVQDLSVSFGRGAAKTGILEKIGFTLRAGETLGLLGESGSGKSVTALSIMGLIEGASLTGDIRFEGQSLTGLSERALRAYRGTRMSMIFQEPMTSLNPVFTIGDQLSEPVRRDPALGAAERKARVIEALRETGIPNPERMYGEYPHRLSGGMRQRAMIALALVGRPKLLIADEPTTALDVTVQAQILAVLARVQKQRDMAMLLVTHDFGVVAQMCDRVAVMYAGQIVEVADVATIFDSPRHPYTQALLASRPHLAQRKTALNPIPGTVPRPGHYPAGCLFAPRCTKVMDRCRTERPQLRVTDGHSSRCWLTEGDLA